MQKSFVTRFYLILHACVQIFDVMFSGVKFWDLNRTFILYFGPSSLCSAFATECNFLSSFLLLVGTIVIHFQFFTTVFSSKHSTDSSRTYPRTLFLFSSLMGSFHTGHNYVVHQQVYCSGLAAHTCAKSSMQSARGAHGCSSMRQHM